MDIIKTIEGWRRPERVKAFLGRTKTFSEPQDSAYGSMVLGKGGFYVFQLGRGKPHRNPVERLWFVFQGKLYGHFAVARIEQNIGQFADLVTLYKKESIATEWHLRDDNWVVLCKPPFIFRDACGYYCDELVGHVDHSEPVRYQGFQGWRYFDLETYLKTPRKPSGGFKRWAGRSGYSDTTARSVVNPIPRRAENAAPCTDTTQRSRRTKSGSCGT